MMGIPVNIPSKIYPFVIYAFFCLFEGPRLDYAIAIVVGYLCQKGYVNSVRPSTNFVLNLESPTGMLRSISRSKRWILAGTTTEYDAWTTASGSNVGDADSILLYGSSVLGRLDHWTAQEEGITVAHVSTTAKAVYALVD